ncbi:MAG: TauD/TfdA family dioxygenase [Pseudomonadales bacterium]|nr:TauD/TfdA family dioxygenase [Pseudomonadales bacterium]
MSTSCAFQVNTLDGSFGAEVRGLTFDNPPKAQIDAFERALRQHLLVVCRGQNPPTAEQMRHFFAHFGELNTETSEAREHYDLLAAVNGVRPPDDVYYVSNVVEQGAKKGFTANSALPWHNDQYWIPRLKTLSILEAEEIPDSGTSTLFCNMYAAYETLPRAIRDRLKDKLAVHDAQSVYFRPDTDPELRARYRVSDAMHPVFQPHPNSGRRALYVSSGVKRIAGVSDSESGKLLDELMLHAYQVDFIYEHNWSVGDFAVWDNVGLQHRREAIPPNTRRTLRSFGGVSEQ